METVTSITSLVKDLHASPPGSFIAELAEAVGRLKTLRRMASFWCRVVAEVSDSVFLILDLEPKLNHRKNTFRIWPAYMLFYYNKFLSSLYAVL